jgi:hypothetical protein
LDFTPVVVDVFVLVLVLALLFAVLVLDLLVVSLLFLGEGILGWLLLLLPPPPPPLPPEPPTPLRGLDLNSCALSLSYSGEEDL